MYGIVCRYMQKDTLVLNRIPEQLELLKRDIKGFSSPLPEDPSKGDELPSYSGRVRSFFKHLTPEGSSRSSTKIDMRSIRCE